MKIVVLKIVSFNRARGFGFAQSESDPRKVFVHIKGHSRVFVSPLNIWLNGFYPSNRYPKAGDVVCTEISMGPKGPIASRWVFDTEFLEATNTPKKSGARQPDRAQNQERTRYQVPSQPKTETPWWIIFGFSHPRVTMKELKSQYRSLARLHHPDCGGNHSIMAEINSAYEKARFAIG